MNLVSRVTSKLSMGATEIRPRQPMSWIWMRIAGRFTALRKPGKHPPALLDESSSLFPDVDSRVAAEQLALHGYAAGFDLTDNMVATLRDFFANRTCYRNGARSAPFDSPAAAAADGAVTAYYFDTMDCDLIRTIAADPKILNVAALYFGSTVHHLGNQAWWSFPMASSEGQQSEFAQLYHFDLDAWRFLKFFFYVTDVAEGGGEHVYVLESHRARPMKFQRTIRRFSDAEIAGAFAPEAIKRVTGKAGAGFVEDTFGLHKGQPPKADARLYFELEYANTDYGVPNDRF
jgi:hypothetical protein